MITAFAAQKPALSSVIDTHFGRCAHFVLFDEVTGTTEIIPNPGKGIKECKGEIILAMLKEKKVNRVVAGDFGTTVQQLLNKNQIQMIIHTDNSVHVSDIIVLLKQNS